MTYESWLKEIQINKSSNGFGRYRFYYRRSGKNTWMITQYEYERSLKRGEIVGYSDHMGYKLNIDDEITTFVLFSKTETHLTYKCEESKIFKGVNKILFLDNDIFSQYYSVYKNVSDYPNYVKNYLKNYSKRELAEEVFNQYKYSYIKSLEESDLKGPNNEIKLIYLLKSNFSVHYVEFRYNQAFICSSLGILPVPISKLYLHTFNKGSQININKKINMHYNKVYFNEEILTQQTPEKEKTEIIEKLVTFNKNISEGSNIIIPKILSDIV